MNEWTLVTRIAKQGKESGRGKEKEKEKEKEMKMKRDVSKVEYKE